MANIEEDQMINITANDTEQNMKQIKANVPRLNGEMLHNGNFEGCEISIVGKYLGRHNDDNTLQQFQSSDGTKFMVKLQNMKQPWNGYKTTYIEIRGFVNKDRTITQISYQEWGNKFTMSTWDKLVILSHQYPSLF